MGTKAAGHTPGPWEYAESKSGRPDGTINLVEYFVRVEDDDVAIACDVIDPKTCKPSEANARLIAAAPDLLEAAECALVMLDRAVPKEAAMLRAAIAKALGES